MEIRIYASLECFRSGKVLYCHRVSDPDNFSFSDCLSVFRSLYGSNVIVVFVCV